jgi:hypothetical protein
MNLRTTAIHDVTIRAYVLGREARNFGTSIVHVPKEMPKWVSIRAGSSVVTGLVLGVEPRCLPDQFPTHIDGVPMVLMPGYSQKDLPKEFFGLFRIEVES